MLNHITMFQPSAIDNALSTMQILHKLITQINTIIDEINSIDSRANEYTDEQINILKDFLVNKINTDIENTVNTLTEYIDNQDEKNYNILNTKIDNVIKQVYIDIAKLKSYLILYIDDNDNKIKVIINEVYEELYNLIKNGNDIIYSPVDGNLKSTKDVIVNIMNIIQQKNGINWTTFENLCSGDSVDMIGYTQPNNNYNIWLKYEKPTYAITDYLDINGLHIVCLNEISSILIDNEPFTDFTGGGVLFPLNTFNSSETTIVITDVNNNVTTIHVKNTDYSSASVTWESLENKLNVSERYNNWNALSFYTVEFANNNLMATDGKMKDVLTEIMYTTEFNKKFFGGI